MSIFLVVLIIVAVYFFLVFFVLRLVAPFMGFGKYQPPKNLPPEIKDKITELENSSYDQMSYLRLAFDFVLSRWYAVRYKAATDFIKLFRSDLKQIWQQPGYAHCTTQNFILNVLLLSSKYFKTEDIKVRHVFLNFVPHQYLQVRVNGQWIDVDPAATSSGIAKFGEHGSNFG